jgi:hypothetical protein
MWEAAPPAPVSTRCEIGVSASGSKAMFEGGSAWAIPSSAAGNGPGVSMAEPPHQAVCHNRLPRSWALPGEQRSAAAAHGVRRPCQPLCC